LWVILPLRGQNQLLSCEDTEKAFVDRDDAGIVALIKSKEKQHLAAGRGKKHFFRNTQAPALMLHSSQIKGMF